VKFSVVVPGPISAGLSDLARQVEDAKFTRAWTTETPGRDALLRSSHLLAATATLQSGTGIAFAFTRPPLVMAALASDTYVLSGDRFTLGLGAGTRGQRRWFGVEFDHPASRMADYIAAIRAILASNGRVRYEGPFYDISVPRVQLAGSPEERSAMPIYGGGLHGQMLNSIARSCDGVVLHPLANGPRYLDDVALPALDRPDRRENFHVAVWCPVSVDESAELARVRAAEQLAFYFSTPSYLDVADHAGFGSVASALVERFNSSGARPTFAELAATIPDDMLDHFVLFGDPAQAAEKAARRISEWRSRGVDEVSWQISAQAVDGSAVASMIDHLSRLSLAAAG
jgi:alkanesulfonate monooxygenase SsuD/methylene tetrahydromethanopterin reductase-like flavin-dependent oxidoreductase (luciferase family)